MSSRRQVQPGVAVGHSPSENNRIHLFQRTLNRVTLWWNGIQIGNRTHYSVERVLAFRDYCDRTSPIRAVAVCVFTPIPAASVMLLIECIPLRNPEEGWQANYTMFIRVFVSSIFVGGGIVFLAKAVVTEAKIATGRAIAITLISAVSYTLLGLLLAATWKFPIPFGLVFMVSPFVTMIMTLLILSIDRQELRTNAKLQKQLVGHVMGTSAQSLLVIAYPTFNAVFLQLSGIQQAISVLILPVIKFVTKQIIAQVASHLEDHIGAVIVFSVDVFNVLYVAICMQTARSSVTTVILMSSDILHILVSLRTIYYHTREQSELAETSTNYLNQIVSTLAKFKPQARPYAGLIRLNGPYNLPLSPSSTALLGSLSTEWSLPAQPTTVQASPVGEGSVGPSSQLICHVVEHSPIFTEKLGRSGRVNGNSVVPVQSSSKRSARTSLTGRVRRVKFEETIHQRLQVLFHSEYVILSEYIECMLPLLYAGYLTGLYRLPTAAYYPFTRSLRPVKMSSTLIQLLLYGTLEFLSFLVLHVLLKKRLGYLPVFQLAFVLETHAAMIQSLLFIWVIFIVQLTLVHAGVDLNAPFQ